jgi:formylglycine-generating enzyme required for sulfatase activity
MGSESGDEQPVHEVTLDAFYIDQYEVTNARFRQCVEAGLCEEPTTCVVGEPTYTDETKDDHPVVCVDWNQAKTYCEWRGDRLPTEAEWEKAARGTDGRTYPWGENITCQLANYTGCEGGTTSVGSYPDGVSPYGVYDMAGNVWEWVADWYDAYPESAYESGNFGTTYKVLRGGSWYGDENYARSAHRLNDLPVSQLDGLGFRCVSAAPE